MIGIFTIVIVHFVLLKRKFYDWLDSLSKEEREDISARPALNLVNYLWISKIMSTRHSQDTPTADEMCDWILTGQIDAIHK